MHHLTILFKWLLIFSSMSSCLQFFKEYLSQKVNLYSFRYLRINYNTKILQFNLLDDSYA